MAGFSLGRVPLFSRAAPPLVYGAPAPQQATGFLSPAGVASSGAPAIPGTLGAPGLPMAGAAGAAPGGSGTRFPFLQANSNALLAAGAGLLGGGADAWQRGAEGWLAGTQVDRQRREEQEAEAEQQSQMDAVNEFLNSPLAARLKPEERALALGNPEFAAQLAERLVAEDLAGPAAPIEVGDYLVDPSTYQTVWSPPRGEAPTPYTDIGKVNADLAAGLITPELASSEIARLSGGTADVPTDWELYQLSRQQYEQAGQTPPTFDEWDLERRGRLGGIDPTIAEQRYGLLYQNAAQEWPVVAEKFEALANLGDQVADFIPVLGNFLTSEDYQVAYDAVTQIVQMQTYALTGAAATESEARRIAITLMPSPGDTPERVRAKLDRIRRTVENLRAPAGPAAGAAPSNGTAAPLAPPAVGTVIDGYRFNGGDPADQNNWTRVP